MIAEVKDSDSRVRLHKFVFNAEQTYLLEFGDFYLRIVRNGVQLLGGVATLDWADRFQYRVGDVVAHDAVRYQATVAHISRTESAVYAPWTSGVVYGVGDRVVDGGVTYQAVVGNTAVAPSGSYPLWTAPKLYEVGTRVTRSSLHYQATQRHVSRANVALGLDPSWIDGHPYKITDQVALGGTIYSAIQDHVSVSAVNRPGSGTDWHRYWEVSTWNEPGSPGGTAYWIGTSSPTNQPGTSGGATYWIALSHNEPGITGIPWTSVWTMIGPVDPTQVYELPTPYGVADLEGLQFEQEGDIVTIVTRAGVQRALKRFGHTSWTLEPIVFVPSIDPPNGVNLSGGISGSIVWYWTVTAISASGDESIAAQSASSSVHVAGEDDDGNLIPATVTWNAVSGAVSYNVFRSADGATFGFLGESLSTSFVDYGNAPSPTLGPPLAGVPMDGEFPAVVGFYQQRKIFGSSAEHPETVVASRIGSYNNFSRSSPLQDDDAVSFSLFGSQVNEVRHVINLGSLLIGTSGGIWEVLGDADGVLTPTAVNPKRRSGHGMSTIPPLVVSTRLIYVQARGTVVREFQNQGLESFADVDLSVFSAHLFAKGRTIVRWDYQVTPQSVVWAVRSDGTLLGLTYLPEHEVVGWHRHDTDGAFEDVCVVPEGAEDAVYVVVRRTIGGQTKRYIERFASREWSNVVDAVFMDSTLSYDGRNANVGQIMSILPTAHGGNWDHTDFDVPLECTAPIFDNTFLGKSIFLTAADGTEYRLAVTAIVDPTSITVRPNTLIPLTMRGYETSTWSLAVDTVGGLDHLEGKAVSVFADGFVVGSPNNPEMPVRTVAGGVVTLDRPYAVIHVGLPFISDLETLDLDTPQGPSLKESKMLINTVGLMVLETRGVLAGEMSPETNPQNVPEADDYGSPIFGLREFKVRFEETYDEPNALRSDYIEVGIQAGYNKKGRIFLRQIDPEPVTILAAMPTGTEGGG